jgi:ABC-type sulfate/molybdate transport systems ATPase subunit
VRVTKIDVGRWRNMANVTVEVDRAADFVCLVGENGAGKSNLLELVAFSAPHFGLGDVSLKRPFPGDLLQPFDVTITLDLGGEVSDEALIEMGVPQPTLDAWDGTLTFTATGQDFEDGVVPPGAAFPYGSASSSGTFVMRQGVYANGVGPTDYALQFAGQIISQLQQKGEVLSLFIDAERVFPEFTISDAEVLERARQDHRAPQAIRQQAALATQNLYIEWMREMLGEQQRRNEDFIEATRLAQLAGDSAPRLEDPLESYRRALTSVLPHLEFVQLDHRMKRLIYNSSGYELPYEQLSGGERELSFLVGQLERFGVQSGLFLLDEPELHLNAELLQRWLSYLRSSISSGQVWIATHSLEAVEAAGLKATLVLERGPDRSVRRVQAIDERPVLTTLAPLLGTPAFSVATSTFVLVEGTRTGRERERFVQVAGTDPSVRFLEAGGCSEVAAQFRGVALLATEAEQVRVGAVIDRDHRSDEQVSEFVEDYGLSVLEVFEIENFFLHPDVLDALRSQRGDTEDGHALLVSACDSLAGVWIWERAVLRQEWRNVPHACKEVAQGLSWQTIEPDRSEAARVLLEPLEATTPEGSTATQRRAAVAAAIRAYGEFRVQRDEFWRQVNGKEALREVAVALNFSTPEALESRAARLWRDGEVARPLEAVALRTYISGLALVG